MNILLTVVVVLAYLAIGVAVAILKYSLSFERFDADYFHDFIGAMVTILLWPCVLLGMLLMVPINATMNFIQNQANRLRDRMR